MREVRIGQSDDEVSQGLAERIREETDYRQQLESQTAADIAMLSDPATETMQRLYDLAYQECFVDTAARRVLWDLSRVVSPDLKDLAKVEASDAYAFVDPGEGLDLVQTIERPNLKIEALCRFGANLGGAERLVFASHARQIAEKQPVAEQQELFLTIGRLSGDAMSLQSAMHLALAIQKPALDLSSTARPMGGKGYRMRSLDRRKQKRAIKLELRNVKYHNSPLAQTKFLIRLAAQGYLPALRQAQSHLLTYEQELKKSGEPDYWGNEFMGEVRSYGKPEFNALMAQALLISEQLRLGNLEAIVDDETMLVDPEVHRLEQDFATLAEANSERIQKQLARGVKLPREHTGLETIALEQWRLVAENSIYPEEGDLWDFMETLVEDCRQALVSGKSLETVLEVVGKLNYLDFIKLPELEIPAAYWDLYRAFLDDKTRKPDGQEGLGYGMVPMHEYKENELRRQHAQRVKEIKAVAEKAVPKLNQLCVLQAANLYTTQSQPVR